MKRVLFVHQSAELYGSDKVLLHLAEALRSRTSYEPVVLVPNEGPLVDRLTESGIETHVVPLAKVSRRTFTPTGIVRVLAELRESARQIDRLLGGRKVDLVYSNTIAVLAGAFWARARRLPHVWHVHEILRSPALVRKGYPLLLKAFATRIICNSSVTRQWLVGERPSLAGRSTTIWNGQGPRPPRDERSVEALARELGLSSGNVVVTLVGRINRWKGHDILIKAAELLVGRDLNVRYLIVGSPPPGQPELLEALRSSVSASPARSFISMIDFRQDVWPIWDLTDIAVVPSTEPEPFGLVAIEAMASGKPVIAARHGGLLDIVDDGVTGLLVEPGSAEQLADAILRLVTDPLLRDSMGHLGSRRQAEVFSLEGQAKKTLSLIDSLVNGRGSDSRS